MDLNMKLHASHSMGTAIIAIPYEDGVVLGGTYSRKTTGFGSSYLHGFFDGFFYQAWKEGMTKDEAEQLVIKAVSLAIARGGGSGGVVHSVVINSEGVTKNFYPVDKLQLWYHELEPHE